MSIAYTVSLTGSQQVPPIPSAASGTGTVIFDDSGTPKLTYTFRISGIDFAALFGQPAYATPSTADDVNGDHFHTGARGVNGPIVFDWSTDNNFAGVYNSDGSWTVSGVWDAADTTPFNAAAQSLFSAGV